MDATIYRRAYEQGRVEKIEWLLIEFDRHGDLERVDLFDIETDEWMQLSLESVQKNKSMMKAINLEIESQLLNQDLDDDNDKAYEDFREGVG